MKKLKLSRANSKIPDEKQPKISIFFTLSKSVLPNPANVKKGKTEEAKTTPGTNDLSTNQISGPSCRKLCTQCLQKSPENKCDFCSNCNLTREKSMGSLKVDPTNMHVKRSGKISKQNYVSLDSDLDIIPPTPPPDNKFKRIKSFNKSSKRKCSFDESAPGKKKCSLNTKLQNNTDHSSENKCNFGNSGIKNNMCLSEGKENIETLKKQNNIRKSPSKEETLAFYNPDSTDFKTDKCNVANSPAVLNLSESTELILGDNCIFTSCVEHLEEVVENKNSTISDVIVDNGGIIKKNIKNAQIEPDVKVKSDNALNRNSLNETQPNESIPCKESETAIQQSNHRNGNVDPTLVDLRDEFQDQPLAPRCNSTIETDVIRTSFLDDLSFDESTFKEPIRLDNGVHCKVVSLEHLEDCREVLLTLKPSDTTHSDTDTAVCVLRDSWASTVVSVGDSVSVTARPVSGQDGCWVVDNNHGLLVIHPDTLLSGTSIVGSLFCMRRSVLSDMYRGMDSDSSIMVMGSFLHELLQEVLKRKVSSLAGIKEVLNSFVSSQNFMFSLYSSGMSLEKTTQTLNEFVPKIHAFVQKYITSGRMSEPYTWNDGESWRGTITDVADIEENIWCPKLGVKGKVDVTVKTCAREKPQVMPLELKTGRASFSAEHRGQVVLYTMMMSELGQVVDSGLLLYLREGVMKEVKVGAVERRDLMLLRNQLVTQLKASHHVVMTAADSQQVAPPALPPPIHHHSACAKCPYLTLCSAALRVSGSSEVSESNPLHGLSASSTDHLQLESITYVFHWTGLLRLEHSEICLKSTALQDIWTLPPELREKRGTCIPNVRLVGAVVEVTAGSYEHVFEWTSSAEYTGWAEGDYMILSSSTRPAVAAGPIRLVLHNKLTLHLERDLSVHQKGDTVWNLDKYESQTGLVFNMTNLGCLLDNTEQAGRLRKAVISLELPIFSPKLSSRVLKASVDLLAPLNGQQRRAIFQAVAADHYILIKGMPGTGKTATIVALVQLSVRLGYSVLITSHTHSAVDNVLLRLRGHVDFLRLGAAHKLHVELAEYGESSRSFNSPEEISTYYNSKNVVAVTCLGSAHPLLSRRQFDLCIVDEATQVLQPTVLRPLFSARKFILIGDPNQLPPLVRSTKAKELGLGQSLFVRLDRPAVTCELSLQYRMNQCITALANTLTYAGRLQCANSNVASATLKLPHSLDEQLVWVRRALVESLDRAVMVLDTGVNQAVDCVNHVEADIVVQLLTALKQGGLPEERVGVITPYRAQVELLRKRTTSLDSLVEVNTVDQYQGRDKDVILYSCTRSAKPTGSDILGDRNRLTVAITRARHKLIIIGNVSLLRGYEIFHTLFNSLPDDCIISLS